MFKTVYRPGGEAFFVRNGLLYLDLDDLADLADNLAEVQPLIGKLAGDPSLRGLFGVLETAVEEAGAGEPGMDPVIDREAEQAALDLAGAEEADHASSTAEETGGTIFGCNIPLGGSGAIGAEYALLGVGLLGLGFRRPAGALRDLLWPARRG
ncbi:MAG: hypothetical protein IIB26_06685 [Chloroflexi bacterium]|nr:hypothetical protein [Chloroflexota bacterium]